MWVGCRSDETSRCLSRRSMRNWQLALEYCYFLIEELYLLRKSNHNTTKRRVEAWFHLPNSNLQLKCVNTNKYWTLSSGAEFFSGGWFARPTDLYHDLSHLFLKWVGVVVVLMVFCFLLCCSFYQSNQSSNFHPGYHCFHRYSWTECFEVISASSGKCSTNWLSVSRFLVRETDVSMIIFELHHDSNKNKTKWSSHKDVSFYGQSDYVFRNFYDLRYDLLLWLISV